MTLGALGALALLGACARPEPPARAPDFEGVVLGRTPRLDAPPVAPRLLLAERAWTAAPGVEAPDASRVTVEVGSEAQVLEQRPDGGYRPTETSDAWVGRGVRVWYTAGAARGGGPGPASTALRPVAAIVVAPAP